MKVLVTGAGGYIGSVLVPKLLNKNYEVVAVDTFYFGKDKLNPHKNLTIVELDVRKFEEQLLSGIDAVIDLVAISNDPSGELFQEATYAINHRARANIAGLAKKNNVKRYILPSSCSIYGFFEDGVIVNEQSKINPLTTYAKANGMAEEDVLKLSDEQFCVTVIRQATIYGHSKRMRFDLAVNAMTYEVWKNGKLPLMRDGKQWRPFLHIEDTTDCMIHLLTTDITKINGEIFNIGANTENYRIVELANTIRQVVNPDSQIEWYGDPDHRSYQVDFSKIEKTGWRTQRNIIDGVNDILEALEENVIDKTEGTITLEWYRENNYFSNKD